MGDGSVDCAWCETFNIPPGYYAQCHDGWHVLTLMKEVDMSRVHQAARDTGTPVRISEDVVMRRDVDNHCYSYVPLYIPSDYIDDLSAFFQRIDALHE